MLEEKRFLWLFNELLVSLPALLTIHHQRTLFKPHQPSLATKHECRMNECRYLFYNSLNKRTQSSLCLFIQFSLRSIISKFFSSPLHLPLLLILHFHPSTPFFQLFSFHHQRRCRYFIKTRLNGLEQSRVISYPCFLTDEIIERKMRKPEHEKCTTLSLTIW